jgi:formylglycine-generating enzyme required for sulfatase activity
MRALRLSTVFALALTLGTSAFASGTTLPLPATTSARAESGVALLRPVPSGRLHVAGGRFTMGSTIPELQAAIGLCEQEPRGAALAPPSPTTGDQPLTLCRLRQEFPREAPAHPVTVSPFAIDRTEVTVEDFARCIRVGVCDAPSFPRGDVRFDQPRFPMTHVAREEAAQYCTWAGGRLPTEAEWELAARGIAERVFPWGTRYNPHLANHGSFAHDPTDGTDGYLGLAPVGSFPDGATPEGLLDMAGNVAEWVSDQLEFVPVPVPGSAQVELKLEEYPRTPQVNPVGTKGSARVARGGSYLSPSFSIRGASRFILEGNYALPMIGFRCAQND